MNKGYFGMTAFKSMILCLMNAHAARDGIELQKLEAKIIDKYKETTMSHHQYTTLIGICEELIEDWRTNNK